MTAAEEATRRALAVARDGWHAARRWEEPLPVPVWVEQLRAGLGPAAECCCTTCRTSDARAAHAAEVQRLWIASMQAQCQTLGHVPGDVGDCTRCGESLSRADWSELVAQETLVPTPTEQARIDATLAHVGHNAGESPAEVLRFADELDVERDAAAREGL